MQIIDVLFFEIVHGQLNFVANNLSKNQNIFSLRLNYLYKYYTYIFAHYIDTKLVQINFCRFYIDLKALSTPVSVHCIYMYSLVLNRRAFGIKAHVGKILLFLVIEPV